MFGNVVTTLVLVTLFWKCCKTHGFSRTVFGNVVKQMSFSNIVFGHVVKPVVLAIQLLEML